jgi:hypothetical protein
MFVETNAVSKSLHAAVRLLAFITMLALMPFGKSLLQAGNHCA